MLAASVSREYSTVDVVQTHEDGFITEFIDEQHEISHTHTHKKNKETSTQIHMNVSVRLQ